MTNFNRTWEEQVLAGALKDAALRKRVQRAIRDVRPWSSDITQALWDLVGNFGEKDVLTDEVLSQYTASLDTEIAEDVEAVARSLQGLEGAPGFAVSQLEAWARRETLTSGLSRVVDNLTHDNVDDAEDLLRRISRDPDSKRVEAEGGDWFSRWEERQARRLEEKLNPDLRPVVPTRLPTLDELYLGGLRIQELGIVVGPTNIGKSFFALHLAFVSAQSGFTTLWINTEMSVEEAETRVDARCFRRLSHDFVKHNFRRKDLERFEEKRRRLRDKLRHRLWIYSVPIGTLTKHGIEDLLDEVEDRTGEKVTTLITDSADHMRPIVSIADKRLQQSAVYWDQKALTQERRLAGWATCQAVAARGSTKGYKSGKELLNEFDTGESKEKAMIAHKILTLNQTAEQYRQDLIHVFGPKNRGGEKNFSLWLATDYARATIEETDPPTKDADGSTVANDDEETT